VHLFQAVGGAIAGLELVSVVGLVIGKNGKRLLFLMVVSHEVTL
jgi:hypothetical protein